MFDNNRMLVVGLRLMIDISNVVWIFFCAYSSAFSYTHVNCRLRDFCKKEENSKKKENKTFHVQEIPVSVAHRIELNLNFKVHRQTKNPSPRYLSSFNTQECFKYQNLLTYS